MEVEGRSFTQRKMAGASLLTKARLAARERTERSWTVGRIGGFELTCTIQSSLRDARLEPYFVLERTDYSQSIDLDAETTAVGIIARLEHAIDRMDAELPEQRRRGIEATARLAGYQPRLGETFPLQGELDDRLAQLLDIEADLASTEGADADNHPAQPRAIAA
jgi:hypothetical protein